MRDRQAIWMLVISLLMGLTVVVLSASRQTQSTVETRKVLVAAGDLELGTRLQAPMLASIDWPQGSLPVGTFSETRELQDRVLKNSVQRGEAILSSKLAAPGSGGGLSAIIAEGKRAITVRVNDVVGVAGFALPGNHVDVLVNARQDRGTGGNEEPVTRTVLENVLVLAVAQEAGRDDTKPKLVNAVTLELSPADAEKIDLARNIGTLALVLRNQIDRSPVLTSGISKRQLLQETPPETKPSVVNPARPARSRASVSPQPKPEPTPSPAVAQSQPTVGLAPDCSQVVQVIQAGTQSLNCF